MTIRTRASGAYGTAQPDVSYPQPSKPLSKADRGPRLPNALQVLLQVLRADTAQCGFPDVSPGPGPFITLAVWRTRRGTSFPRGEASRNSLPGGEPTLSLCFGSCVNLHLPIMRSNFITIITNLSRKLSRIYHEFITNLSRCSLRRVPGSGHRGGN